MSCVIYVGLRIQLYISIVKYKTILCYLDLYRTINNNKTILFITTQKKKIYLLRYKKKHIFRVNICRVFYDMISD